MMLVAGADGVALSGKEWPGRDGPQVLAVHATGFCKEVWEPVAAELAAQGIGVVAFDQRGHGSSSPPPGPADWWGLGRDVATVAKSLGPFRVGLGHSSGATALTMAALFDADCFAALVLVEPVVFPPGADYDMDLAESARKRRAHFADLPDARRHFTGRGIFTGWVDAALDGYLRGGLVESAAGLALACSPELEAEFYEMGVRHGVWERLDELAVPTRLLIGSDSRFHRGQFAEELAGGYRAQLEVVPNTDHFLPMQDPAAVVAAVTAAIRTSGRGRPS